MPRMRDAERLRQIPLGLEPRANPFSETALRAAYRRTDLSRRLSFEQAMSDGAYAIGIRNLALAAARRLERRRRRRVAPDPTAAGAIAASPPLSPAPRRSP